MAAAQTGAQALVQVRDWRPHAVVLDVMLPDMEGFEVAQPIALTATEYRLLRYLMLNPRRVLPNKAAVAKFVACVKQHGYNLPTPNFSGKGSIFPAKIKQNTKFRTASRACASTLRPQVGAGAPSAGGGG